MHTFLERGKKTLFLLIVFLFVAAFASASGQQEDRLSRARSLIEERQYNDAIVILAEVMREEPRKFDEAQNLLKEVRKARKQYNNRYQDLIELYEQEDMDMDEAYQIFQELEQLDKSPNKATVEAFEKARQTAIFVFNNNRFNNIMAAAGEQIAEGQYYQAVETYLTGFDLYIEEYERRDYGNIVENRIAATKADLRQAAENFINRKDEFERLTENEEQLYQSGDLSGLEQNLERVKELLLSTYELRQTVQDSAEYFRNQNNQFKEGGEEEEFHLTFLYLLSTGREKSETTEGIIQIIDTIWQDTLIAVEEDVTEGTKTAYNAAKQKFDEGSLESANDRFADAGRYAGFTLEMLPLWGLYIDLQTNLAFGERSREIVMNKLPSYNTSESVTDASRMYRTIIPLSNRYQEARSDITDARTVEEVADIRSRLVSIISDIRDIAAAWNEKQGYYTRIAERNLGPGESVSIGDQAVAILSEYESEAESVEVEAVERIAEIRYTPLYDAYDRLASTVEEGLRFLNGYEKTIGEGETETTYTAKDPTQSKEVFESIQDDMRTLEEETETVVEELEAEKEYIVESEKIRTKSEAGNELVGSINRLQQNVNNYIAQAEEQILLAQKYRGEAEFRISQAEEALERREFDRAREQLRIAADRFDRALEVQDDTDLRASRNERIASLNEEINTVENNIIVAEVRELIEQGKSLYAQERYSEAERLFQKAQSRWKVTHAENKPEIDYWLGILRIALNVKSGRVIDEANPLYPEMRRYLNLANEDFLQGKRLVEEGKEEEAAHYFEAAEQKILYVKMAFPLNREASVLSLRIEKFRDIENFDELFRQKFNQARNKLSSNPQEAYIELKDLEAINPDYPGMDDALYNAEVRLGIRIPPPDPAKVREANELYEKAYEIVQSNVRSQFPIALEYLNKAIELTPNNQKVTNLLDRIEAEMGGRSTIVLASNAQQQYKLAEEKYLEGSYYEALRIVNNLMKDKRSSQYPPLLELKRRIESRI